jgi:hypothetical protein
MGPKFQDGNKQEAKQFRSGTLWEVAEYLAYVAPILALYRPSHLGSNFSYEVTLKRKEVNDAAVNTFLCVLLL